MIAVRPDSSEATTLPEGWEEGVLEDYIERPEYGFTDSASDDSSGTKFLRITDIQDGQVDWGTVPYCKCPRDVVASKRLLPGDVVVARIGATTGKSFFIDSPPHEAVFASYLIRLRARPTKLLPRFLYFYMQTTAYWAHVDRHKGDRLKGGVNIPVLESLPVVVPPIEEQARIIRVLECVHAAARSEATQAAVSAELKGAALSTIFTSGLRGEPLKQTDIGTMPESWQPKAIRDLCDIWSGGTPRKSVPEYWKGDVPWVSGKDLKAPALDDAIDHLSSEGVEAGSRLAPKDAVLLLVRGMGLAKDLPVAVISRPMAFNQDVKALVSRGAYSGRFLRSAIYAGKERLLSQIVPSAHGTMTLNLNDVETFHVACPSSPDEAAEIVAILESLDRKADIHRKKQAALDGLFAALLHKLTVGEARTNDLDLSLLPPAKAYCREALS